MHFRSFGRVQKMAKYYEAVNMAIAYEISRPCGGENTPRSCMLTTVASAFAQDKQKLAHEQGVGRLGE